MVLSQIIKIVLWSFSLYSCACEPVSTTCGWRNSSTCFPLVTYPPKVNTENGQLPKKKTIMWLDTMHFLHGLRNTRNLAVFNNCKGIASNCEILGHTVVNPRISDPNVRIGPYGADAILIMASHLKGLPMINRRDSNQVFVFVERENWYHYNAYSKIKNDLKEKYLQDQMNYFNWTMTYRYDSDIILPYGYVLEKPNFKPLPRNYYEQVYSKKKYSVAWFVSHCTVPARRGPYVEELRKYIDVHIYGRCGDLKCRDRKCFQTVIEQHKFILSFENTFYQNYVTEKLFSLIHQNVIQVVRGGGIDYSLYGVPDNAVIDADGFNSAADLAKFLKSIDKETYINYLQNREKYFSVSAEVTTGAAYCTLCAKLNDINAWRKSYTDIGAWYSSILFAEQYCPSVQSNNGEELTEIFNISKLD